ncbi:MAG TPA: hypothetical protein VFL62_01290 [Bradyrhizobium sp.]|uniref:hypothetical protein n=1 Tax=Bradyrhizobium sp. TaxID=376 RepID=UPI002D811681|nr:hypothetical protein [Bradyrhizobium sp.]HET7884836.1 hypothetical protein [Bradyrhizobium sp.]
MIRTVSFLFSLPAVAAALLAIDLSDKLALVGALLGILAIVSFAIIATGSTIDHDV